MNEDIKQIAERIRAFREMAGMSLETFAKQLDMPKDKYLKYESGSVDIPVSLLFLAAQKLNVELAALLAGEDPKLHIYCVVRKGKGLGVERRRQYKYESLAYNFVKKKVEPFLVVVEPEPDNAPVSFNAHQGQEFTFMLEGTMKVIVDNHEIILNEGDSLYFDSSYQHAMKALDNKPARFLAIII